MSTHPPRRRRLLLRTIASAVGAAIAMAMVAAPSPALAIPPGGDCFDADDIYSVEANHGEMIIPVEPLHVVKNDNPSPIQVTFTSSTTATVWSTAYSTGSSGVGLDIDIVNASVEHRYGYTVTRSVTTETGIIVGPMTVPSGKTQYGLYGGVVVKTTGTYWTKRIFLCDQWYSYPAEAYSTIGHGWHVWQE